MKKAIFALFTAVSCILSPTLVEALPDSSVLSSSKNPTHVHYHNIVLAKVNNKAVTLYDVVKKLDMVFYRQFPQFKDLIEAKYQFYTINWKYVMNDLVEKELVLADGEENNIKVTTGEIRQELETLFGPNIVANLDELGLTYDEAWNMVKGDLTIRRVMSARINPKAIRAMTPQAVRKAYEAHAAENILPEKWTYRVISFRDKDTTNSAEAANLAHYLLTDGQVPFNDLVAELTKRGLQKGTNVSISEEFSHTPKEVSELYRGSLISLEQGTYSVPIAQKSKAGGGAVVRLFYMKEKKPAGAEPLDKVEVTLKEKIFSQVSGVETEAYFTKLRKNFSVQTYINADEYQPFTLQ
ncbi:MAG: peptidylprolyl isomerase [Parachlamydiales bacterium]|jgi:hypothetical protein